MKAAMPQEVEVWYLLPALRNELTALFVEEYDLKQKEVAELLGVSASAVSQYKSSKRGHEIHFNEKEMDVIRACAKDMVKHKVEARKYFYQLSVKLRGSESLCALHKKLDSDLPHHCDICMSR